MVNIPTIYGNDWEVVYYCYTHIKSMENIRFPGQTCSDYHMTHGSRGLIWFVVHPKFDPFLYVMRVGIPVSKMGASMHGNQLGRSSVHGTTILANLVALIRGPTWNPGSTEHETQQANSLWKKKQCWVGSLWSDTCKQNAYVAGQLHSSWLCLLG